MIRHLCLALQQEIPARSSGASQLLSDLARLSFEASDAGLGPQIQGVAWLVVIDGVAQGGLGKRGPGVVRGVI
jgi:hypothetical protein